MTIRPFEFTGADYEAFAVMQRSVWPGYPDTVQEWKHWDRSRGSGTLFRRYVAEVDGVVVGAGLCCEPWRSRAHGKYHVSCFEEFEERSLRAPGFNAGAHFVALDGDRWVGTSSLWVPQGESVMLYTGLTGVVRSHRRQGIASAMKVRRIAFARQIGAKIVQTDNEESNPMYWLNLHLGFEPQPAWLDFQKELS